MDFDGINAVAGACGILLIAPHGNMKDDMGTSEFTLAVRDILDCYAITNTRFRKGVKLEIDHGVADLYKRESFLHPELKSIFWDKVTGFLDEILARNERALILHIHGIKDSNAKKVAVLNNGHPGHVPEDVRLILGYGQHFKNPRFTADHERTVRPLLESFSRHGLTAQPAPTEPIFNNGHKTWYCGNDRNRMNQYLCAMDRYYSRLQSLQVELRFTGVRDTPSVPVSSREFARAVSSVWNNRSK